MFTANETWSIFCTHIGILHSNSIQDESFLYVLTQLRIHILRGNESLSISVTYSGNINLRLYTRRVIYLTCMHV